VSIHSPDAFAAALLLTLLFVPVARAAARGRIVDSDERDADGRPMTRAGGLAMTAGWALALLWVGGADAWPVVGMAGVAVAVGLHDDLTKSSPRWRLAVLAALALNATSFGFRVDVVALPGGGTLALGALAVPLSMLWILGANVAFDFIDGLDGLAAGLAAIACVGLLLAGAGGVAALAAAAMAGACAAFLAFNRPPASAYMGDNGSNLLGFVVGCVTLAGLRDPVGAFPVTAGLLLIAVPVLDGAFAVARRATAGPDLFASDRQHLHHRLLRGRSPGQALFVLLAAAALCALGAVRGGGGLLLGAVGLVWLLTEVFSPTADASRRSSRRSRRS